MAASVRGWPQALSDVEAIERLQSILLLGCEGNQDLVHGREYKALRRVLISRADLADALPSYVRSQRDLASFWAYIKSHAPSYAKRREHVRSSLEALFERIEGRSKPPISSAAWTGRRTPAQQAAVVVAIGYDALAGVEYLLEEQERGLHNGGPVEPERVEAIDQLKALHHELGELIGLAHEGAPLAEALRSVKDRSKRALRWTKEPIGFAMGALPQTGISAAVGVGIMGIVDAMFAKGGVEMGAATMGVHMAATALEAQRVRKA